jgi:hypothetical protein
MRSVADSYQSSAPVCVTLGRGAGKPSGPDAAASIWGSGIGISEGHVSGGRYLACSMSKVDISRGEME